MTQKQKENSCLILCSAETNCKTCLPKVFQEIFGINVAPLVVNVHSHTKRGSSN